MFHSSVLGPVVFDIYLNDLFFTLFSVNVCNFADDTTPFVCKLNLEVVLTQLEECSELVIAWFQNNYMKLNTDKCHLLVAGHKSEHTWVRVGPDKIWEDHSVKLLGVSIDNELKFDKHVLNITGVLVKVSMLGETDSMVGYHLITEGHSIQLGV